MDLARETVETPMLAPFFPVSVKTSIMKNLKISAFALLASSAVVMLFLSARSIPKGAVALKPFSLQKYLGKWYEIARLDYKWERNLDNVTAQYSLRPDGNIKVENKGYNVEHAGWEKSIGKAKPVRDSTEAMLKVSFFGPFYSGYNVIAIDPDYKYALVAGESTKYLWILSREKTIPKKVKEDYLEKAQEIGYDTDELVWVKHDKD
jgi:apolipoprotein D and lipocalin family protein